MPVRIFVGLLAVVLAAGAVPALAAGLLPSVGTQGFAIAGLIPLVLALWLLRRSTSSK